MDSNTTPTTKKRIFSDGENAEECSAFSSLMKDRFYNQSKKTNFISAMELFREKMQPINQDYLDGHLRQFMEGHSSEFLEASPGLKNFLSLFKKKSGVRC